jgi:hypothetical protein
MKNLVDTALGPVDKRLEYILNGLAHFQDESLRLFGITLKVLAYIAGKLTQGGKEHHRQTRKDLIANHGNFIRTADILQIFGK